MYIINTANTDFSVTHVWPKWSVGLIDFRHYLTLGGDDDDGDDGDDDDDNDDGLRNRESFWHDFQISFPVVTFEKGSRLD